MHIVFLSCSKSTDEENVMTNGNFGFIVVASWLEFGEDEWLRVRRDFLSELRENTSDYRELYRSLERSQEFL